MRSMIDRSLICLVDATDVLHIPILTLRTTLVIRINSIQDSLVAYFGKRLSNDNEYASIPSFEVIQLNGDYTRLYSSAYTPSPSRDLLELALQVIHADGNPSLELKYVRHEQTTHDQRSDVTLTTIILKDPVYPFQVKLYYKTY